MEFLSNKSRKHLEKAVGQKIWMITGIKEETARGTIIISLDISFQIWLRNTKIHRF